MTLEINLISHREPGVADVCVPLPDDVTFEERRTVMEAARHFAEVLRSVHGIDGPVIEQSTHRRPADTPSDI